MSDLDNKILEAVLGKPLPEGTPIPDFVEKIKHAFAREGYLRTVDVSIPAITNYDRPKQAPEGVEMSNIDDKLKDVLWAYTENGRTEEDAIGMIRQAFTDWLASESPDSTAIMDSNNRRYMTGQAWYDRFIDHMPEPHTWTAERTSDEYSVQYWSGWNKYHDLVMEAAKRAAGIADE